MSQILHIFRKDTRRFWPEIGASLAALAGVVCVSEYAWRRLFDNLQNQGGMVASAASLPLLLVVSWALLITRVIHAESLVGDSQFWLTRPYDWKKLLAAKVLFLLAYLYLPLTIAQWMMLKGAGFHPQWHVAGLLYNLLLITSYMVIPCVALACVTADVARMVLTLVGIFACSAGFIAISSGLIGATLGAPLPAANLILRAVLLCLCVVAIGLQYATRRTWLARLVLLSIPVWVFAISELAPMNTVEGTYAQSGGAGDDSPRLVYSVPENESLPANARSDKEIGFSIPVETVDLADKTILTIDHFKISMEAPDGTRWVSLWHGSSGMPVTKRGVVFVVLPRSIYNSFVGKPLSVHLTLAISEGQEQSSSVIPLPSRDVAFAGDTVCSATRISSESGGETTENVSAWCRFPIRRPYYFGAGLLMPSPDCGPGSRSWYGSLGDDSGGLAIDPVLPSTVLNSGQSYRSNGSPAFACSATGVTLSEYRLERRMQVSLTIAGYQLPSLPAVRR